MNKLKVAIGFMACLTPFVLVLTGSESFGYSISSYYWANNSVLFVGLLSICGSFLIYYEGFDFKDKWITTVSGLAMYGVACFPCLGGSEYLCMFIPANVTSVIHGAFAFTTFLTLGYMSYFQFTQTDGNATNMKVKRNKVYRGSGVTIFVSLGLIVVVSVIPGAREFTDQFRLFYILESVILEAFGISWLTKAELILGDE